jgi:ribonuclease VapC
VIVVDTSAVVAALIGEEARDRITSVITTAPTCLMSAATFLECGIVLTARYGAEGVHHLRLYLNEAGIEIVNVDREQSELALVAWTRFGKGRHRAGLNYGDCLSYSLAMARGAPLLFVGDDFSETDVAAA